MYKIKILVFLLSFPLAGLIGQKKISGKVTDRGGSPLIGVTVLEDGTLNGTTTDLDGMYTISVKDENSILTYSYIGMNTARQVVGESSNMDVVSQPRFLSFPRFSFS